MDISAGISNAAIAATAQRTGDAVAMKTLNKAMDVQVQSAAALISSAVQTSQAIQSHRGLPDNVGRNINVTA